MFIIKKTSTFFSTYFLVLNGSQIASLKFSAKQLFSALSLLSCVEKYKTTKFLEGMFTCFDTRD